MKKLLVLLLLAAPVYAGTLTITTTAAQDARIERARVKANRATCLAVGLAEGCTQAQARAAFCAPGSAPCTVDGVGSATIRVFANANDFAERIIRDYVFSLKQAQDAEDLETFAAWRKTATTEQKNAVCAAAGLPAGCLP